MYSPYKTLNKKGKGDISETMRDTQEMIGPWLYFWQSVFLWFTSVLYLMCFVCLTIVLLLIVSYLTCWGKILFLYTLCNYLTVIKREIKFCISVSICQLQGRVHCSLVLITLLVIGIIWETLICGFSAPSTIWMFLKYKF